MPTNVDTEFLFPNPSAPPSSLSPYHWPGISPESTRALREILKDNHERWHIFFNDRGFHNHSTHRAIAIWSLGVDPAVLKAGYKLDCEEQRPAFNSPEAITDTNFEEHLGDGKFYDAYLDFVGTYVREHGIDDALETFIFSKKYNTGNMEMLSRFLAGLLHPLIHTGYGAEFNLPGMLVEGIAQTCVHPPDNSKLLPKAFFDVIHEQTNEIPGVSASGPLAGAGRKIGQVADHLDSTASPENVHALTILARVAADSRLKLPNDLDELAVLQNTITDHADIIREYAMQWSIDLNRHGEIERKVTEIAWMNTLIYGVAGWTWAEKIKGGNEGTFNADFFLLSDYITAQLLRADSCLHLLTSAAFIPSLVVHLSHSPVSQVLLLRSYLSVALSVYVARARPRLDLHGFFTSSTNYPLPFHSLPTPNQHALLGQDKVQAKVPDPWLFILQTTTVHPDQHLPKAIRALASWASRFGATTPGTFCGPQNSIVGGVDATQGNSETLIPIPVSKRAMRIELPGAEYLDGTLFIRTAGLTIERMGRVGQGEAPAEFWDLSGFFEDPKLAEEAKSRIKERIMSEL